MVKIFVGNINENVSGTTLERMFSEYGKVTECAVLGNYGFVHMATEHEAQTAIKNMDKREVNGSQLNVEISKSGGRGGGSSRGGRGGGASNRGGRGGYGGGSAGYGGGFQASDNSASAKSARRAGCTKLHVAGLPENCQSSELRRMFERYGYVAECDVVEDRNIAFVHIEDPAAEAAVHGLNGYSIRGVQLKVQFSKNQKNALSGGPGGPAPGGYMQHQGGRQPPHRGAGRPGAYPPNGRPGYGEMQTEGDRSYGAAAEAGYESILPPPAKDRMELLDLLDRRRRLENLDPYERRLIACPDPYNLPPPPPEFIRLLRERALVKARLPLPPSSSALGRALPTAGATTTSSALARAIVARRAAASVAKPDPLHAVAAAHESYADPKAMPYASVYGALTEY